MPSNEQISILEELTPPFRVLEPAVQSTPFIFCSPHSGAIYPRRFVETSRLDSHALRKSEDVLVDQLFQGVTTLGAPLIAANFPRAYIFPDDEIPVSVRHLVSSTALPTYLIPRYYAAISDVDGRIEITGLEAGRKLEFQLFHPDVGKAFAKTIVAGKPVDESGTFELTLQDGINDIGDIDISNVVKKYIDRLQKAKP